MTLKELRKKKKLTQEECACYLEIPLRTYQNYENDPKKVLTLKYKYMMLKLEQYGFIDESHGILSIPEIEETCYHIFNEAEMDFCYLFGSYAKGIANETSDVDLLVSTPVTGMKYYDLVETLREGLKKKVDVINLDQLKDNFDLTSEILKDGIKIYG